MGRKFNAALRAHRRGNPMPPPSWKPSPPKVRLYRSTVKLFNYMRAWQPFRPRRKKRIRWK